MSGLFILYQIKSQTIKDSCQLGKEFEVNYVVLLSVQSAG